MSANRYAWRGLLGAALVFAAAPVGAQSVADSGQTKIAPGMSPLDVLLVKDAILENWAEYTLLFDGDGMTDRRAQWADRTFTPDLKWRWYDADGKVQMAADSREEMRKQPQPDAQASFKHLPITIKYDSISPTEVKTRTVVLFVDVPRAKEKGAADGVPGLGVPGVPQTGMAVYHDTWRKEGGKWMKSVSILHSANKGFWPIQFYPTKSHPTPQ